MKRLIDYQKKSNFGEWDQTTHAFVLDHMLKDGIYICSIEDTSGDTFYSCIINVRDGFFANKGLFLDDSPHSVFITDSEANAMNIKCYDGSLNPSFPTGTIAYFLRIGI